MPLPQSRSYSRSVSPHSRRAQQSRRKDRYSRSRSPRRRARSRSSPAESHHYRSRSPRRRPDRSYSPRRRDRSPSPYRRGRSRSRSPPRRKEAKSNMSGGFRWKEKPSHDGGDAAVEAQRPVRGYNKEPARPRQHSVSPLRNDVASKFGSDYQEKYQNPNVDAGGKLGIQADGEKEIDKDDDKKKKKKKEKKEKGPRLTNEPMIIVNVNDRLGTKAAIPCLGSDPIKQFKALVAARIGREPHEIMIKRQGERPFKDHLTLEDYGVSNGVQLDLEVDTGD